MRVKNECLKVLLNVLLQYMHQTVSHFIQDHMYLAKELKQVDKTKHKSYFQTWIMAFSNYKCNTLALTMCSQLSSEQL